LNGNATGAGMFEIEFNPQVSMGDLLTAVSLLMTLGGLLVALFQTRKAVQQSNKAVVSAHYSELDRFYNEVLAYAITHPFLRSPKLLRSDEEALKGAYEPFEKGSEKRAQYDAYAHFVWNFIETVHDRCVACESLKDRANLIETWKTAIHMENRIHRGWFLNEMREEEVRAATGGRDYRRADIFRREFQVFVLEKQWFTDDWSYQRGFAAPVDFGLDENREAA
jgi:hypothetical protein